MIEINKEKLRDKITACWIGKNIGGTMGAPFEGTRKLLDISGFSTPPNKVLPNDDLDLQLLWLKVIEDYRLECINEKILGEYWVSYITGQWNEYGISKLNLKDGLLPPLSGSYNNDWKNSNGAWIRTEIWSCIAPACPNIAAQYAKMDAMVDHGAGEGTYAAIFIAAIESAAFIVSDIRVLIDIGLSKIPKESRTARAIRLAINCYENNMRWEDARNAILEEVSDIGDGWFEAPGNVAYVIIGLLYGEGDFKKSMITAINCGDDTDCTAGTVGSILGIIGGTKCLPKDLVDHIGDSIVSCSLNLGLDYRFPDSCKSLTERVYAQIMNVVRIHNANITLTDGEEYISDNIVNDFMVYSDELKLTHDGNYFDIDLIHSKVRICYESNLEVSPSSDFKLKIIVFGNDRLGNSPYNISLRWLLPDGWTVTSPSRHYQNARTWRYAAQSEFEAILHIGEKVEPINRIILEMVFDGRPTIGLIPINVIGGNSCE